MKFTDAIDKFMHLVPGCPEPEAVDALRDAVIQFCDESNSLCYWVDKASNALTFAVDQAAQQMPVTLFDAYLGTEHLDIIDLNDLAGQPPTGETRIFWDPERIHDSIQLLPAPASVMTLSLLLSWRPTPWASDFPDHLWFGRAEAMKAGALARLMSGSGTSYSNPGRAQFYEQTFMSAIGSAGASAGSNRRTKARRLRVQPAE